MVAFVFQWVAALYLSGGHFDMLLTSHLQCRLYEARYILTCQPPKYIVEVIGWLSLLKGQCGYDHTQLIKRVCSWQDEHLQQAQRSDSPAHLKL